MNTTQVLEVILLYREKFETMGIPKVEFSHTNKPPNQCMFETTMPHCHGMLDRIAEFVESGKQSNLEKGFRWIGFIQGVLWMNHVYTIEEMKGHNRTTHPV